MGVKGLLYQIRKRYPLSCRTLSEIPYPAYNCLYIDASTLLVAAISIKSSKLNTLNEENITFAFHLFDSLVHLLQPTDLIYIALEGSQPISKTYATHNRFYQRNMIEQHDSIRNLFQPHLKSWIQEKIKNDDIWKRPKVIFAGSAVPGEAETKIFDYIRQEMNKPDWDLNKRHCIFTPDSDLILMTLRSHIQNFDLIYQNYRFNLVRGTRTPNFPITPSSLTVISINILREYLKLDFEIADEQIFDDFVTICDILGSDYCAPLEDVVNLDLESLIQSYKSEPHCNFITDCDNFNFDNLKIFLNKILKHIAERKSTTYTKYVEKQRKNYFETRKVTPEETEKISHCVLDSLLYIVKSYAIGIPSWSWVYQYHFAPPLCVVLDYIETFKSQLVQDEPTNLLQSLMVSLKGISSLSPPYFVQLRETDPYLKSLRRDISEIEYDETNERFKFEIPNLQKIKDILEPHLSQVPKEYDELIHPQFPLDMKTMTEIPLTCKKPFRSDLLISDQSKINPSFYPFDVSLQKKSEKRDWTFDIKINSELRKDDPESFIGKRVLSQWPNKTVCRVLKVVEKPTDFDFHILLNPEEKFVLLAPIDPNTNNQVRKEFVYPWSLTQEYSQQEHLAKKFFSTKVFLKIPQNKNWKTLNSILKILEGVPKDDRFKTMMKILGKLYIKKDNYALQFHYDDFAVPFFLKIDGTKFFVDKEIEKYIKLYISKVPESVYMINERATDEDLIQCANELYEIMNLMDDEVPKLHTKFIDSYSKTDIVFFEKNKEKGEFRSSNKTYSGYNSSREPKLGDTVVITDNRTVLNEGSAGIVFAYDKLNEEAWIYVPGRKDLTSLCHALKTFSGVVVSKSSLIVMND
ncbi:hypothetical protein TVAG_183130 [Trichomonas vaginalis G3]|uniref:XRN 5'-3' exonuclease N-terminus family protein n=1 Tax=Trichomonas vaginalis (strain ATCC PRA-98 / G3) TaxID=412133 RepID=A2D951_TRIV3|nr:5'-3' exoribonuclease protein [Trichomonas vaginalis G3]EAY23077.1 hypothetical protein TVAG_183130 [Trichomonas vaginalis G3]KAI5519045.1 5'-3' exoribonuclease protein [Trichomonas vaginalis G3]|eukprot:XP_001584063.1 hypothetical protein [Trichomonas vaginalis G3]